MCCETGFGGAIMIGRVKVSLTNEDNWNASAKPKNNGLEGSFWKFLRMR